MRFTLGTRISLLSKNKVAGYAVGGGHVLHMVCDLTIAADNAIFGQTGPKVFFLSLLGCTSYLTSTAIVYRTKIFKLY